MLLDLLSLLTVLTLGVLSPGPDFLVVFKNSVGGSRLRAFATIAGIVAGLTVQMTVIAIGFTAVPLDVVRGLQLCGAVFLAWIGGKSLFFSRNPSGAATRTVTESSAFLEGLACNVTNPKAFLFYVSLFAQVVKPGVASWSRSALPVLFVLHAATVWTLVAMALQSPPVARRLVLAQRWLPGAFGIALLTLAAWVAWHAWPPRAN